MWWGLAQLCAWILTVCSLALTPAQAGRELQALPSHSLQPLSKHSFKDLRALFVPLPRRSSRDVNSPAPVDCQLSQWSGWTDCFPCQEKKVRIRCNHRYRRLERPAEFGGRRCAGHLWDEQACRAETPCSGPPGCGQDFQCKETEIHPCCTQIWAHADSGFAFEFYDDSKDLLDALKSDKSKTTGFTIGIGPGGSDVMLNLGLTLSGGKGSLKNFTQYDAKEVGFIRAVTKVQTARFKMRRDNIVLDEDVLLSLQELPDTYNYGMYAKFINDYGTHFMTSGTMGGVFEYILVINKEEMRRKAISMEQISACVGLSLGITASKENLDLGVTLKHSDCKQKGFLKTDAGSHSAVVEDIIPRIRGGDTSSSGGLLKSWDGQMYRHWGRSLKYNPAVIDFQLQPIHEILRRSNLGHMKSKEQHLRRALGEFLQEFSPCRCRPCLNNGEPVLLGDSCSCHCRPGDRGAACQHSQRPGGETDGRWSCWSGWSPCQAGTARRSRHCSNPAPQHGGQPCAGRDLQSRAC
ncbi:hypothetical protein EK904_003276 [Melospiza melodia maxima]|nr:hypothetical protein EK904_003276 [Melospiza melodia maxima]